MELDQQECKEDILRGSCMRNQGHVTVFLSIILISMLLLGLSVLEMARIRMGSAKAAMAAEGVQCFPISLSLM